MQIPSDVLITLIIPYLPPTPRKRMLMTSCLYRNSSTFIDKLTLEWIESKVNERVMWKYDLGLDNFVIDTTKTRNSIYSGTHRFEIPPGYETRHSYPASKLQWIILLESVDVSKPYIGILINNSTSLLRNLSSFEFRIDTINEKTNKFQYAYVEDSILSVCYSSRLVSRSRQKKTYATEFHLFTWKIDTSTPTNPILHRLPHRTLRGLFSNKKVTNFGLVDDRIFGQGSVVFEWLHMKNDTLMAITELKQSALLLDETTPIYFSLDLRPELNNKTRCVEIRIIEINVVNTSDDDTHIIVAFVDAVFDDAVYYTRIERNLMIYEYRITDKKAVFKNKLVLHKGVFPYPLGIYNTIFERGMVIITVGFSSQEYRQYSYESLGETSHLRPLARTVINKSSVTELM